MPQPSDQRDPAARDVAWTKVTLFAHLAYLDTLARGGEAGTTVVAAWLAEDHSGLGLAALSTRKARRTAEAFVQDIEATRTLAREEGKTAALAAVEHCGFSAEEAVLLLDYAGARPEDVTRP